MAEQQQWFGWGNQWLFFLIIIIVLLCVFSPPTKQKDKDKGQENSK